MMLDILHKYELASRQKVNIYKMKSTFDRGTPQHDQTPMASLFGSKIFNSQDSFLVRQFSWVLVKRLCFI